MKCRTIPLALLSSLALSAPLQAACPTPDQAERMAADWLKPAAVSHIDASLSLADAECTRDRLVSALGKSQGRVVGYKAGLTNPAVQQRFAHDAPVRGVLLEKMLLPDGAEVAVGFGARPLMEADLVVEVADDAINDATTPEDIMRHLKRIQPFIELPDLPLDPAIKVTGAHLLAINAGARAGVLGQGIAAAPELVAPLGSMTVVMKDQDGTELGKGPGAAILGHPLNAVRWIAQDLQRGGQRLKAGDLLSLGSFTAPVSPKAGQQVRVSYEGLPGMAPVSVRFR